MTTATELRALVTQALDADPAASNWTLTLAVLAQMGQVPHTTTQYERVKQALVRQRRRTENPRPWGGARPNSGPPPGNTNARQRPAYAKPRRLKSVKVAGADIVPA